MLRVQVISAVAGRAAYKYGWLYAGTIRVAERVTTVQNDQQHVVEIVGDVAR
jgi:hypothetical protein